MQGGAWTGRKGRLEAISMQGRVRLEVWAGQGLSAPEGEGMYRGEVQAGRNTRVRCGPGGERAVRGGRRKRHPGKGSRLEVGARVRTSNMSAMVVTLDVSKLSGWLKSPASCRVARWAYEAGGGACREVSGRCAGATAQAALQGRALGWRSGRGHAQQTWTPWL